MGDPEEIGSMPRQFRVGLDRLVEHVGQAVKLGIPAIALFPIVRADKKDAMGSESTNPDNIICQAARKLKCAFPEIGLIGDVALDPYTDHGHDGILRNGYVDNDESVDILVRQALLLAEAGIDVIAPSDMMDGRVRNLVRSLTTIFSINLLYKSSLNSVRLPSCASSMVSSSSVLAILVSRLLISAIQFDR